MYCASQVKVRGQPVSVGSLPSPFRLGCLNSDHQTWQQTPLLIEVAHQPPFKFSLLLWFVTFGTDISSITELTQRTFFFQQ